MFKREREIREKEDRQRCLVLYDRIVYVGKRVKHVLQNRQQTHPNRHISQIPVGLSQISFF